MNLSKNYLKQLSEYIKRNLKRGYTKESLKWALVNQGHSKLEVEKAMKMVDEELASEAPILETTPEIKVEVSPAEKVEKKESFWKRLFKNYKIVDME